MAATGVIDEADDIARLGDELVQLARLALAGREQDVQQYIHRLARRHGRAHPSIASKLVDLLRESPRQGSPLRGASEAPAPVDLDSRLSLVRHDVAQLDISPIFGATTSARLEAIRDERRHSSRLTSAGLIPSKSALFVGPPGVGKTMAARWLSAELSLPLLVLDLSAVMSSLLGRTGVNIRRVLDYAKRAPSILLLDELDAVAKRRDDVTEIGELKRLVTVLLQEIDDWPHTSLLLSATNHPDLLDPAVWRRFDHIVSFEIPDRAGILASLSQLLREENQDRMFLAILAEALLGSSFSEVERFVLDARRRSVIEAKPLGEQLERAITARIRDLSVSKRIQLAVALVSECGLSQRKSHELTGVSRDTIRKHSIGS